MKNYINTWLILLFAGVLASCTKQDWLDTSFVQTAANAGKVAAFYNITQDNTGRVTITPNAEGAVKYDIHFGDGSTTPRTVMAGDTVQHLFREGIFPVKIVAYSLNGQVTETTQDLTVSFRAPENFEPVVAIDATNNYKVNVSAKAIYETNFAVTFGDVENEIPRSFQEGETISHTYAETGTYTVRVVALSGGAASTVYEQEVTIVDPVLLPITFESPSLKYEWGNFGGGQVTVVDNPHKTGINTSNRVGKMVKQPGEGWGGSVIGLGEAIDFANNKYVRIKVWSPRVGARLLFKVENAADAGIFYEKEVTTTVANDWEDLVVDFSGIDLAHTYERVVLIFDLGTPGDGTANYTFYFDDIRVVSSLPAALAFPIGFENSPATYKWNNFDGGDASVVENPHKNGINTSNQTGKMVKHAGQPWGGSWIALPQPIDFSKGKFFRMKVWSPRAGSTVLFKLEKNGEPSVNFEKSATTTVANAWEDLVFDLTAINAAESYDHLVLIFDLGTQGDGSANYTWYFDDIRQVPVAGDALMLPLGFESSTLEYNWTGFDGGGVSVVDNPVKAGINTSSKVAKMVKGPGGQPWGGAFLELESAIPFVAGAELSMKVLSPRAGAKVLLKVENKDNGGIAYEKEMTTTVANAWEELVFDYSGVNLSNSYHKLVIIFDNGATGDGSANYTWYFDDITFK